MMYNLTDVVKNLILINVVVFLILLMPFSEGLWRWFVLYPPDSGVFSPAQIVTHMFNHGGMTHLFFNMLGLFFFGPNVERVWGAKKFLFYYMICGLGAAALHMLIGGGAPVLGASGAVSGVLLAFAWLFPNTKVMLLIPPIPMKAKHLVMGILAIDLFMGLSTYNDGIAHFAHLGGAVAGFLLILFWQKNPGFMA